MSDETLERKEHFDLRQITLETDAGTTTIDFYQQHIASDELIFVFPVLGGRPIISTHFARFFAENGFNTAIVHRSNEFKDPENFEHLEELFRKGIIRDRNAIDYFSTVEHFARFGTFGVSRGGINVAITAGVDPRLEYNIIAVAGADLPGIFRHARERKIQNFMRTLSKRLGKTPDEIQEMLEGQISTDPKYLARFIDGRKTLLFLALCDSAVPARYGRLLRNELQNPRTIFFLAGHKGAVLFTQFKKLVLPFEEFCLLPPPYIEGEALLFFRHAFHKGDYPWELVPWRILQLPLNFVGGLLNWIGSFDPDDSADPEALPPGQRMSTGPPLLEHQDRENNSPRE